MSAFENLGEFGNLSADARMECGICWHVYDPSLGDDVWQIPPGVAFTELPEDWRCPNCDAPKTKFMILGAGGGGGE